MPFVFCSKNVFKFKNDLTHLLGYMIYQQFDTVQSNHFSDPLTFFKDDLPLLTLFARNLICILNILLSFVFFLPKPVNNLPFFRLRRFATGYTLFCFRTVEQVIISLPSS